MNHLFAGLKVVELAGVLAGPAVGLFFAELGATVLKVENKRTGGDPIRNWKLPQEINSLSSSYYHSVNWNKQSVLLDFNDAEDLATLRMQIKEADVLLVNFKGRDAAKWRLDNTTLREQFPGLIIGEIKGYPESDRPAYDAVLQAETGFLSINGTRQSGPLKMPVAFIDLFAGHQLKEGILIAMLQRFITGKGSTVSVSLEEAAIASLANQASAFLNLKHIPERIGSLHPAIAPYGETFTTADNQWIILAVGTDDQFKRLCQILDMPQISIKKEYATNQKRVQNRKKLAALIAEKIRSMNAQTLMTQLLERNVPAGVVKNIAQVFETSVAQQMVLSQEEADGSVSHRVRTAVFNIDPNT